MASQLTRVLAPSAQRVAGLFSCLPTRVNSSGLPMLLMPACSRSPDRASSSGEVRTPPAETGTPMILLLKTMGGHAVDGKLARFGYSLTASPLKYGVRSAHAELRKSA